MGKLFSGRRLARLGAVFPSRCTIEREATSGQDAYGQPVTSWATVGGLSGLACRVAPAGTSPTEGRRSGLVVENASHVALLAGAYPQIEVTMRASIDSACGSAQSDAHTTVYEIVGVELDGNETLTRLHLRRVVSHG